VKVFVDTAAWIALANTDDQLHPRANQIMSDRILDFGFWILD
jgi:predicted nucleic acid-binding protein